MTYLLIVSLIFFACVLLSRISGKLGIPILLSFIVLGMLFGSDGIFKIHFDDYSFAENICSVALIFIMFYGGFGTNVRYAKNVAVRAVLLSTVGVLVTFAVTGVFCHFALRMNPVESFLIGALISSTDAASVFSILRSKKLNLKYNTASMLEIESGSNDPCAYMLTATMIAIAKGGASVNGIAILIVRQVFLGLLFGGITRKTAIGLATTIINNPVRSAGPITAGILDGNDKSPNRKNISTCISPVVPSKKLTRFLLL